MNNSSPQNLSDQDDEKLDDQARSKVDHRCDVPDSTKTKKVLSKREIMEQLSRERFPWDE